MDEFEARQWLEQELDVPRETFARLDAFIELLRRENEVQNLVSRASLDHIWVRHIVDSAQLLRFAPKDAATWLDLGTGAGFPGLIIAALHPDLGALEHLQAADRDRAHLYTRSGCLAP